LPSSRTAAEHALSSAPELKHPWRGYFFIAMATFCWGGAVALGKKIFNGGFFSGHASISPVVLTQVRTTFTILLLGPLLWLRFGRSIFKINRHDLTLCALVGTLGVASSNYFYYLAVQKSTVSLAITVQYIAPIWVLLYMVGRGREPATLQKGAAALVAMIGTALAVGVFNPDVQFNAIGVGAALLASFSFAFYNIAAQGLVMRNHPLTVMFYVLLSAAILWQIVSPPWRLLAQHFSHAQWEFFVAFAGFSMLMPYMFYLSGLKYLDPTRAVITSCLEPVFAILFAVIFVQETLRSLQVVGIAAVLVATVMVQIKPKKTAQPEAA
jgi:drug/metabolite transporter, DME family